MSNYLYFDDIPDDLVFSESVAVDTETMGLNLSRDRLCVVQLSDGNNNAYLVKFNKDSKYNSPNLKKMLEDDNLVKIFHYARFDMATLKYYLGIDIKNVFCTKIASYFARTYTGSHSLKAICDELLNVKISKQQQSSYWGSNTLSKEQKHYAASDVLYLHGLKLALEKILIAESRMDLAKKCFEFLSTRVEMDIRGWEVDIFAHSIHQ